MRALLADTVLIAHFAIAVFITGGLVLVWVGAWRGWRWIRNRRFRLAHLAAIAFVALEAAAGTVCPLTVLEDVLRGQTRPGSFVGRWVYWLLYYDAPQWVFTAAYATWTLATIVTLLLIPPRARSTQT